MPAPRDVVSPAGIRVRRGLSPLGRWEQAVRAPSPHLRGQVREMQGYVEATPAPLERRELSSPRVVLILELGPPIDVFEVGRLDRSARFQGGFVAGLHETFALTRHGGFQQGIEVGLAAPVARRVLGVPMSELAGRTVALRDLFPRAHPTLCEELEGLPDWDARFARVESLLAAQLADAEPPNPAVAWALARIEAQRGAVDVGGLARELGYSGKHLARLFREHVGLTPKRVARIVRFHELARRIERGDPAPWHALAQELGFADQSHLVRDVRGFTGQSPTAWRRSRVPFADGEVLPPDVAFDQDASAGSG